MPSCSDCRVGIVPVARVQDLHVHSELSYCAEKGLAPEFYAGKISSCTNGAPELVCITDHSMAAYFPEDIAWKWEFISDSSIFDAWRDSGNEKLAKHIALLKSLSGRGVSAGIETEMMDDGRLCFDPAFADKLDIVIGSVHFLPPVPHEEIFGSWLSHTMRLMNSGIDILGHPFRWIAAKIEIGEDTVSSVVAEAKRCGVALELNSHYRHPREDIMMLRACAEAGAKVTIASDSHRKEEFGDYSYHMDIMEKAGYSLPGYGLVKTAIRH